MYGKPNALAMEGAPMQFSIDLPPNPESGLFRKDAYPFVAGLLMMEMGADHTLPDTQTRMYLNPWNAGPLHTAPLPIPTLHVRKWNDDAPRMTWVQPAVTNAVETEPPM